MTTVVSISNGGFAINGAPTYPGRSWKGRRIEGLLFNSRMANAIADDENPATRGAWAYADGDWDAERSTREFIAALPSYRAHGLLAVCLNLRAAARRAIPGTSRGRSAASRPTARSSPPGPRGSRRSSRPAINSAWS